MFVRPSRDIELLTVQTAQYFSILLFKNIYVLAYTLVQVVALLNWFVRSLFCHCLFIL